ncbi:2-hydroxycarboxylate transporter family protein [Pullulanibacillus sp. KACC 23026]|uniref:2-hydroxycarboxylate transporter family protein n=1 Tax=Pullulanibacillus sp. KACC 23026 TaxID=3028315 RepID=UPI0023B13F67|nr:2-hydroxycarboxylate transporter family protein [Pullulanibacillus sp. KACC 23026]WEG13217.1 2-hydroxycarboxylate transporter family protein [Pullulanibacillus sp. KACC 23026]
MSQTQEVPVKSSGPTPVWKMKIAGINAPIYLGIVIVVLIGVYMQILPQNMASGIIVSMTLGITLRWIGDHIPIFNTFGGGPILCILIPALFIFWGILPESVGKLTDSFYNDIGFSDFAVTGIIVGSILSMDRRMLMKSGIRFLIPLLGGVIFALGLGGLVGQLLGFGFKQTLFFVVGPVMGGGMAAGAVPMSQIFAASSGMSAGEVLAKIAPAVIVGNMLCILAAGILNGLGKRNKKYKSFTGNGEMLRVKGGKGINLNEKGDSLPFSMNSLITGLFFSMAIYVFGQILGKLIPGLHPYVWIILAAAALKIFNLLPSSIEKSAEHWYNFITAAWVPAILVAISAGMVDFHSVIQIVTNPSYITLTIFTIIVAVFASGFIGVLVGFYFVESSISAGLGMADMGGSGDVAVLSAAERMELMPYLQISSRIGGAIMLLILSLLSSFWM